MSIDNIDNSDLLAAIKNCNKNKVKQLIESTRKLYRDHYIEYAREPKWIIHDKDGNPTVGPLDNDEADNFVEFSVKTEMSKYINSNVYVNGSFLHFAVEQKYCPDVFEILIDNGADINAKNNDGKTPLHLASIIQNSAFTIQLILNNKADIEIKDNNYHTPLHLAAMKGCLRNVQLLLTYSANIQVKDDMDNTPLHLAIMEAHRDVVQLLLKHHANVNAKNRHRKTPLHFAADKGDYFITNLLIEKNADINAIDNIRWTPLFHAIEKKHYDIARLLMDKGAKVDFQGSGNSTVLQYAVFNGDMYAVQLLLEYHANTEIQNNSGKTPIFDALNNEKIAELLLKNGANVNAKDMDGRTPIFDALYSVDITKLLLRNGADVNVKDRYDRTPLHYAVEKKNFGYSVTKLLLENGANVNVEDNEGNTPFSIVCSYHEEGKVLRQLIEDACNNKTNSSKNVEEVICSCPTIESSTKMISNDPTVKAAMEFRNSTPTTEGLIMPYQKAQPTNSSHPEITAQSSNTPNIGAIVGGVLGVIIIGGAAFLGKKLYNYYYRGRNTYSHENNRNAVTESLLEQGQDNPAVTLSGVTAHSVRNNQATTSV